MKGYVYVLSNPSMPGLLKIGFTTTTLKQRIQELSGYTGVPAPFKLECYCESIDPIDDERKIHQELEQYRYSQDREFFTLRVSLASSTIEAICQTPALLSFPSKEKSETKRTQTSDYKDINTKASHLFLSQKKKLVNNLFNNLPVIRYRENGENNNDYIIYGWAQTEKTTPVSFFSKSLNKSLNKSLDMIYGSSNQQESNFYLPIHIKASMKGFCREKRCSIASRNCGFEIYGPKHIVSIDLESPNFFTRERFTEIVQRIVSLEKTLLLEASKI